MAKFTATKAYHFSTDGTEATTWAHFTKVDKSEPPVYEFETTDTKAVAKLRKIIDDDVAGYADIAEVEDKPKRGRGKGGTGATGSSTGATGGTGDTGATGGAGDTGASGDANGN